MSVPALLTVHEVAALLSCSPYTVRAMIRRGDLPAVRLSARMLRVRAEDLEALVRQRLATASSAGTAWAAGPNFPAGSRWWEGA